MVLRGADGTARGAAAQPRPAKYAPAVKTKRTETRQSSRNSIGGDPSRPRDVRVARHAGDRARAPRRRGRGPDAERAGAAQRADGRDGRGADRGVRGDRRRPDRRRGGGARRGRVLLRGRRPRDARRGRPRPRRGRALPRHDARSTAASRASASSSRRRSRRSAAARSAPGLNLALATDLRVVAEDAKLLSGFIPIGLHPGGGHTALLGRLGSRETAAALTLFGERLTGAQAVERGLAWAAVPDAEVDAAALELARRPRQGPRARPPHRRQPAHRRRPARAPVARRARARAREPDVVDAPPAPD